MRNDRRVYIYIRGKCHNSEVDTRLASAIRRAIIANQSRSRFDFSAIVFSAKSCARRRKHHEREMIYSRVNQYTPVVFASGSSDSSRHSRRVVLAKIDYGL